MSVEIKGDAKIYKNLKSLDSRTIRKSREALLRVLLVVEAESMRRTPVDTGFLKSSAAGNAIVYKSDANSATGAVFYTANYATPVHESIKNKHVVGEAKFLENAIKDNEEYIKGMLKADFSALVTGVLPR